MPQTNLEPICAGFIVNEPHTHLSHYVVRVSTRSITRASNDEYLRVFLRLWTKLSVSRARLRRALVVFVVSLVPVTPRELHRCTAFVVRERSRCALLALRRSIALSARKNHALLTRYFLYRDCIARAAPRVDALSH